MTTVNREAFKKTLETLKFKSGVTADNDSEVKVHFHDGYAYTFDDERVNVVPCPLKYNGTASLKHLLASLNGEEREVEITWKDGEDESDERFLTIVNGSQKIRLNGLVPNHKVFKAHVGKKLEWHPLPKDFLDCVGTLETTVSKNVTNHKLSSIHCSPEYFEAASEIQICRFYHKLPDNFEFLFRYGVLKGLFCGPTHIARTEDYCYFQYDKDFVIAIRIFEEKYLKSVSEKIEKERTGHLVRLPTELFEAIKTAELFTDDEQQTLFCTLGDGVFSIAARNGEGQYIARAKIDYVGDKMSFGLKAKMLTDVLKFNRKCIVADDCIKIEDDTFVFLTSVILGPFDTMDF